MNLSELEKKLYRTKIKEIRNKKIYSDYFFGNKPVYYAEILAHQSAKLYINAYRKSELYPLTHPLHQKIKDYLEQIS